MIKFQCNYKKLRPITKDYNYTKLRRHFKILKKNYIKFQLLEISMKLQGNEKKYIRRDPNYV